MSNDTSTIGSSDHAIPSSSSVASSDQQTAIPDRYNFMSEDGVFDMPRFIDVVLLELPDAVVAKEAARRKELEENRQPNVIRAGLFDNTFVHEQVALPATEHSIENCIVCQALSRKDRRRSMEHEKQSHQESKKDEQAPGVKAVCSESVGQILEISTNIASNACDGSYVQAHDWLGIDEPEQPTGIEDGSVASQREVDEGKKEQELSKRADVDNDAVAERTVITDSHNRMMPFVTKNEISKPDGYTKNMFKDGSYRQMYLDENANISPRWRDFMRSYAILRGDGDLQEHLIKSEGTKCGKDIGEKKWSTGKAFMQKKMVGKEEATIICEAGGVDVTECEKLEQRYEIEIIKPVEDVECKYSDMFRYFSKDMDTDKIPAAPVDDRDETGDISSSFIETDQGCFDSWNEVDTSEDTSFTTNEVSDLHGGHWERGGDKDSGYSNCYMDIISGCPCAQAVAETSKSDCTIAAIHEDIYAVPSGLQLETTEECDARHSRAYALAARIKQQCANANAVLDTERGPHINDTTEKQATEDEISKMGISGNLVAAKIPVGHEPELELRRSISMKAGNSKFHFFTPEVPKAHGDGTNNHGVDEANSSDRTIIAHKNEGQCTTSTAKDQVGHESRNMPDAEITNLNSSPLQPLDEPPINSHNPIIFYAPRKRRNVVAKSVKAWLKHLGKSVSSAPKKTETISRRRAPNKFQMERIRFYEEHHYLDMYANVDHPGMNAANGWKVGNIMRPKPVLERTIIHLSIRL
ncbi:hypothetical protein RUND412_011240 [Rhizina undulata]